MTLTIDDEIRDGIRQNKEEKDLRGIAIKNGMITFENSYFDLINNKITTLEECIINKEVIT